jgi:hypothetical protein
MQMSPLRGPDRIGAPARYYNATSSMELAEAHGPGNAVTGEGVTT